MYFKLQSLTSGKMNQQCLDQTDFCMACLTMVCFIKTLLLELRNIKKGENLNR